MLVLIEGAVMCFVLLLICVIGMADGPAGLAVFYENPVRDRVIELGLATGKKLKRTNIIVSAALFIPMLAFVPGMVYGINGAENFRQGFWQMTAIYLIMGIFDRLFIDWYWVGHTGAWFIPGTEDLMPYIPARVHIRKWAVTVIGYPAAAAVIAGIFSAFGV